MHAGEASDQDKAGVFTSHKSCGDDIHSGSASNVRVALSVAAVEAKDPQEQAAAIVQANARAASRAAAGREPRRGPGHAGASQGCAGQWVAFVLQLSRAMWPASRISSRIQPLAQCHVNGVKKIPNTFVSIPKKR